MATDTAKRRSHSPEQSGGGRPGQERAEDEQSGRGPAEREPVEREPPGRGQAQREHGLLAGHAPGRERPLGGYALLSGTFATLVGSFSLLMRRSGRTLPERMQAGDLLLGVLATHKLSRLVSKDKVTSAVRAPFTRYEGEGGPAEVQESARGRGLRRAIGELLTCPYCLGLWVAAAYCAGMVVAPRPTRWIASLFTVQLGSDVLQVAYKKLEDTL